MKRLFAVVCLLLLIPGCGGDDSMDMSGVPPAATTLHTEFKSDLTQVMPLMANVQSSLIYVLNPGSSLAPGVVLTPDTSSGAPPYAFTISGTLDGNGDAFLETTLNGRAVFATDPQNSFSSVSGQLVIAISIPVIGHVYQSTVDYVMTATQTTVSGTVNFTNPLAGKTIAVTVPAGAPLIIKPATGAANARANACGFSMQGNAGFTVTASSGTYRTTAAFSSTNTDVRLQQTSFADTGGQTSSLPDSTTDLGCGNDGTLADWRGTYDVSWFCLPYESGQFRTTAVLSGSSLVFNDEGLPSGIPVTPTGSSPHSVRGTYLDGPAGTQYREDINRTLQKNGGFSEFSVYRFIEGPRIGAGGICASTARRLN